MLRLSPRSLYTKVCTVCCPGDKPCMVCTNDPAMYVPSEDTNPRNGHSGSDMKFPSTSVQIAQRFPLVLPLTWRFCSAAKVHKLGAGQLMVMGLSTAWKPEPTVTRSLASLIQVSKSLRLLVMMLI